MAEKVAEKAVVQSSSAFWRAAGMTYCGYVSKCAVALRQCMKEPFKSQTLGREKVHYKAGKYEDAKPQKPGEFQ